MHKVSSVGDGRTTGEGVQGATAALACGLWTSQGGCRAVGGRSSHAQSQKRFGELSLQPRGSRVWLEACFFPT